MSKPKLNIRITDLICIADLDTSGPSSWSTCDRAIFKRHGRSGSTSDLRSWSSTTFLILFAYARRRCEIAYWWHLHLRPWGLGLHALCSGDIVRLAADVAQHCCVFRSLPCRSLSFGLCRRLWEELFEVFEKIRCRTEQLSDLRIDILNRLRLALVGLQDLKKLLVDLWLRSKTVLIHMLVMLRKPFTKVHLTFILFT